VRQEENQESTVNLEVKKRCFKESSTVSNAAELQYYNVFYNIVETKK
jgi:hypothetical protein